MNELMQDLLKLQTLEFGDTEDDDTAATIAELRQKILPQVLGHYDRLRARGRKGMAAVRNQVCTGCHMRLPLGVIMTLKHGLDIQLCDSCGRYLYLVEEESPAPVAEITSAKTVARPRRRKKATAAA